MMISKNRSFLTGKFYDLTFKKSNFSLLSIFFYYLILVNPYQSQAQNVGINTTGNTPDNSAMLDIDATNKGLLVPRVNLTSTTDAATIPSPATSLMVYNNATAGSGANAVTPGFYFNTGTPAAPNWGRFVRPSTTNTVYGTATINTSSASSYVLIPGMTQTITVPDNSKVLITTDGGVSVVGTSTAGFTVADIAIFIDGVIFPTGGFKRVLVHNLSSLTGVLDYYSMTISTSLTPGVHTIEVRAKDAGGNAWGLVGGPVGYATAPQLTVSILPN